LKQLQHKIVRSACYDHPLVTKPSGLEESEHETVIERRDSGMLSGDPHTHLLGGDAHLTFENDGSRICEVYRRVQRRLKLNVQREDRLWRDTYHDIAHICSYMGLPSFVREEIVRAYANLRKRGEVKAGQQPLEETLGQLTYLACRIQRFPLSFEDIRKAFRELFGTELHTRISKKLVKAFNYRQVRFGIDRVSKHRYLRTWQMISGKRVKHGSLGVI